MNLSKLFLNDKLSYNITLLGFLIINCLAFFWDLEEPAKINTIIVFNFTYVSGILIIIRCFNNGKIKSISNWILIFILKIVITYFFVKYFFYLPLQPMDLMRTSTQDSLLTDSNYYDYIGAEIVRNGVIENIHLVFSTWLSFGVISYIVIVYYIFGISTLYIALFNCLLILGFAIYLTRTVNLLVENSESKYWQVLMLSMLLPYESYYDSMPSKEPLSLFFMYASIYYLTLIYKNKTLKINSFESIGFFSSSMLLIMVRANLGILIIVFGSFFIFKRVKIYKFLFSFIVLTTLIFTFLELTIGFENFFNSYSDVQKLNETRQKGIELTTDDSPLKSFMANSFSANNLLTTILFFPIRLIIWVFLPYPFILPDFKTILFMPEILKNDWHSYYKTPQILCRITSTWIILYLTPFIVRPLFLKKNENKNGWTFLFLLCMYLTVIISTNNFVNGGRYRTVVEPLFLALGIIGMYRYKYDIKYRFVFYFILALPVLFFFLLNFFAS